MARILLSAYACEPGRGSEPGVGWSWATELPRQGHEVTVLTRAANRQTIEPEAQRLRAVPDFAYYDLPRWMQAWRAWPGGRAVYYVLWQWFAVRRIRRLFPALPFDIVHHVTYASARYPSFMGSLGIPFGFGPVSGGEQVPRRLRSGFSAGQRCREMLRDVSNSLVPLDPFMRRTFRQSQTILVTGDTLGLVPQRWRHKATVRLAIGLGAEEMPSRSQARRGAGFHLLYAGRLLEWKGIDLALRAISQARMSCPGIRFSIAGEGPAKPKLVKLCRELGIEAIVNWPGWLSRGELAEHYAAADVLLFPSLRDSGGMVVLEALAHGVPVICTDLGGPGRIVDATCGRAIPTAERHPEQLVSAISDALVEVLGAPGLLASLSHGARLRARQFRFEDLVRSVYPAPARERIAQHA
ncbi:MAG TPA: glycosyltransferase family 4 protein [Candidatus Binatia bacterium]|nr:glycosyltransferase family 4 protein [Candidatus Binatia bacterium]